MDMKQSSDGGGMDHGPKSLWAWKHSRRFARCRALWGWWPANLQPVLSIPIDTYCCLLTTYWYLLISIDIYWYYIMIDKVAGWDEPWRVRRRPLWPFGRRWWWCRPEGCATRKSKVLPCDHFNRQKVGSWKKWTRKNGWRKVQGRQSSPLQEPCPVHLCFEIHLS